MRKDEMRKSARRAVATAIAVFTLCSACGCVDKQQETPPATPVYAEQDFVTFGFWSPNTLTEESFSLYKDSGLNTMLFGNHSVLPWSSDTLHYLGSNATMRSLELCRTVGLNAILSYGEWYYGSVTGKAFGNTPFSDYDLYEEYKDIIVGVHVADEPSLTAMKTTGDDALTGNYKSVYDVSYMVNLYPNYASTSAIGTQGYRHYVQTYADEIIADFDDARLMSVDFYPFRSDGMHVGWLACYNDIATVAKTMHAKKSYYIQTAITNEFQDTLGLEEVRMQLNVAMTFGADWFGFYCYELPRTYYSDGTYEPMYEYCMLKADGTPSPLYGYVRSELARIGTFSDAYLAYNWEKTVPVAKTGTRGDMVLRLLGEATFADTSIRSVTATEDAVVGCFSSERGEAFMILHYGNPSEQSTAVIETEFDGGRYAMIYGETSCPQTVKLENGKLRLELETEDT